MATGYELIYDIKERLGLTSDDARFSNEYILFQIEKTRAVLLKRNYAKGVKVIPDSVKQHIQLDLESTNDNEFFETGDTTMQTSDELPILIEGFMLNMDIQTDGGSYTDLKFIKVPIERFPYVGLDSFLPNVNYYTIDYDYKIKLKSQFNKYKLLTKLRLHGVFMHPSEAWQLSPDYDSSTDYLDLEYPIDSETLFEISNIVVQQLAPSMNIPLDKNNNGTDG